MRYRNRPDERLVMSSCLGPFGKELESKNRPTSQNMGRLISPMCLTIHGMTRMAAPIWCMRSCTHLVYENFERTTCAWPYGMALDQTTDRQTDRPDQQTRPDKTDKTRPDKTDKTRPDKTRPDKTRHDQTRPDKTRHEQTRQTRQTRPDKTRPDSRPERSPNSWVPAQLV